MRGVGSLATDRIGYRTVVIDVFIFLWARRLFCNVFPFPVCKAQLIGNWYENRRGAPITIIFLIFCQFYWRTDAPCANRSGGPNKKKKILAHCVWSALPIGGGGHWCANILADRCPPCHYYWLTEHKKCTEMSGFWVACHIKRFKKGGPRCASPIFKPIAY